MKLGKFVSHCQSSRRPVGAGVAPNSIDVIVSNCVINLAADKSRVLQQAFSVLKDGGELYFSDIYADKVRISKEKTVKMIER